MHSNALILTSLASLASLSGCESLRSERQDRLVSTHLAVLSIEDFESARGKLNPAFKLTGDDALKLVNPTIGVNVSSRLDSFRTSGELGLDITPDALGTGGAAPPALPGSAPKTASFTGPQNFKDALDQSSTLRTSRILEYQLAQSLFEQVAMLNATVSSASVPAGYTGFIVQMQLGVMPRKQELPVDVYADIAFFAVSKGLPDSGVARATQQARLAPPAGNPLGSDDRRIRVVPLLSTDSLESVVNSASLDKLRAYSGGLRLAADRVNAGVSVERILQEIEASLGKQLFSSYSVARLSENTLRARFGAVPTGDGSVSAVPRSHKVPVLILLPDSLVSALKSPGTDIELLASAKTVLIDPQTGHESNAVDFKHLVLEGMKQLAPYFAMPDGRSLLTRQDADEIVELAVMAQENDYKKFVDAVNKLSCHLKCRSEIPPPARLVAEQTPESVWLELSAIVTKTQYTGVRFTISKPEPPAMHLPSAVFALDDGKTWTITLPGIWADRIKPHNVQLASPSLGTLGFSPESIAEGPGGVAKAVFPALKDAAPPITLSITLPASQPAFEGGARNASIPVQRVSVKPPPAESTPLLTSSTKFINCASGTGTAVFAIDFAAFADRKLPSFKLKVSGAAMTNFAASPAAAATVSGTDIIVTRDCVLTLTLTGLAPDQEVAFLATDGNDRALALDGREIKFRVK